MASLAAWLSSAVRRRDLLRGTVALALLPLLRLAGPARAHGAGAEGEPAGDDGALPPATLRELRTSPYVYVSPLRSDGSESRCHAEVWYAWLDGAVVMTVSSESWKARAVRRGLDRARIWVGDYGRRKGLWASSEAFRRGPSFEARARRARDAELLDRLMAAYREKYPDEIGRWEPRMRQGFEDGSRILLRYAPLG